MGEDDHHGKEEDRFFACYLLASLSPRYKGHTYIGFTVNPSRRIRQHNGEIVSGAWRTKTKRPWEMALCIYGFPSNVAALQFEWAWQHPTESISVRKSVASFKSLSGIANKIKLVYTMLTIDPWQRLNLTLNFFSTKYMKYSVGCPTLPKHTKVQVCMMDELPCYNEDSLGFGINEEFDDLDDDPNEYPGLHVEPMETVINSSGISECSTGVEQFHPIEKTDEGEKRKSPEEGGGCDLGIPPLQPEQGMTNSGSVCSEIEVIDLFTPSPDYRVGLCTRRRRLSTSFPEIIDLTRSPVFVDL